MFKEKSDFGVDIPEFCDILFTEASRRKAYVGFSQY
jgi:hypothetical protein